MLDTTGCANGTLIEISNGRLVDVENLQDDDITYGVIAHSLARKCRFGGHCRTVINVAEHSCHVADYVYEYSCGSAICSLAALLHDGSECYLVDLPRPLKLLFPEYVALEKKVETRIYERFGIELTDYMHEIIKRGDNSVLKAEAQLEMPSRAENWGGMNEINAANIGTERWSIDRSVSEFMARVARWT